MTQRTFWQRARAAAAWYGKRLLALELIIVAAAVIVSLLTGGRTGTDISFAIMIAGVLVMAVGPATVMGGWGNTRNFMYLYSRTMEDKDHVQRASQDNHDHEHNMGTMMPSLLLGALTIIIALVVQILTE